MAGRAGYHTVGKLKKLQVENKGFYIFHVVNFLMFINSLLAALSDIFEKFDISGDGTISIGEYRTLCEEYGVPLTEDDIVAIRDIADADGEVQHTDHHDNDILNLFKLQILDPQRCLHPPHKTMQPFERISSCRS